MAIKPGLEEGMELVVLDGLGLRPSRGENQDDSAARRAGVLLGSE